MTKYISALNVSLDKAEEQQLQAQGFKKINTDLNKGAGGNHIFIWNKKESCPAPVTRVQFSFVHEMEDGLINAGYIKIPKNLNAGTKGNEIYLWYFQGHTKYDIPIVEIDVTTSAANEAPKYGLGWERLALDLNRRNDGDWIHIWVKREKQTYICDVDATVGFGSDGDYFESGYIRLDEDTNRGAGGAYVFIWYRMSTDPKVALSDLKVSTNASEYQLYQQQNYQPVSVNLNEGTGGNQVYMWYKKQVCPNPIQDLILLLNMCAVPVYEKAGITVIKRNLNSGNKGCREYLCLYQ
ncbi:uncharacterized protein si:dkey-30j10.5 [Plectropomus leopardus]|uniref:uncharacterized protein si:dkey-30j10.5 n=1 Tax=Plectropomus leopardus TaxID=160734 RepID=UPI001C4AC81E|nr:uncharacterized protein si:dkey-30j10.5 [Plectropomus leopardus]